MPEPQRARGPRDTFYVHLPRPRERGGLCGALRRGHGGPSRLRLRKLRRQTAFRVRLRTRRRPALATEVWDRRRAVVLPERRALPAPVPVRLGDGGGGGERCGGGG